MARKSPLNAVKLMMTNELSGNLQVLTMASPAPIYDRPPRGSSFPYAQINMPVVTQKPRAGGLRSWNASIQLDIFDDDTGSQRSILLGSAAVELLAEETLSLPDTDGFRFIDQRVEIERTQREDTEQGFSIWHHIIIFEFHCSQITI